MKNPCIECLCIPVCKYKEWNRLVIDCNVINDYLDEMEAFVPLNSYRILPLKPLDQLYEVRKDNLGNSRWFKQNKQVGTSTHV